MVYGFDNNVKTSLSITLMGYKLKKGCRRGMRQRRPESTPAVLVHEK